MTATPVESSSFRLGRRPALDGIRAVAILMVVALHFTSVFQNLSGWFDGGFLGVEVFFVLSGFLITSLILEELDDTKDWQRRRFYLRRAFRLVPALYVMIAVCAVAAAVVSLPRFGAAADQPVAFAVSATYVLNLVTAFLDHLPIWASPLWTLCVEVHFYLVWPLLLVAAVRRWAIKPEHLALAVWATSLAIRIVTFATVGRPYQTIVTFSRLDGLAIGALLAIALHRGWRAPRQAHTLVPVALGVLAVFMVIGNPNQWWMVTVGYTLTDVCAVVLILEALKAEGPVGRLLATMPMRRVGELSYSLYLWHLPVFFALSNRIFGRKLIPIAFVVALGVAWASSLLVEGPLRRYGRSLGNRSAQQAPYPIP